MKVFFRSINSCAMRKTDVGKYKNALLEAGHEIVGTPEESDVILVWTCAFRSDFRAHSVNALNEYQKEFGKRVIACGCLPSIDMEAMREGFKGEYFEWINEAQAMKDLFGVDLDEAQRPLVEKALDVPIEEFKKDNPQIKTTHCDQFIKLFISEGCTFSCTYCAELLAFPEYRSFPLKKLVAKCKQAVEEGNIYKVVLHGDLLGEYGKDIGSSFPELVNMLKTEIPGIELGIRNLHPVHFLEYQDYFAGWLKDGTIFLLETPIQSASDLVLKSMARNYTKADLVKLFDGIKEAGFSEVETHIIAGFPGETEEQFQETVDFICQYKPKYVLISGFMETAKIPASKFAGKVDAEVKRKRVLDAHRQINEKGIICNYDFCDFSQAAVLPRIELMVT